MIFSIHFAEFPANLNLKSDEAKALLAVELSARDSVIPVLLTWTPLYIPVPSSTL